MSELLSNLQKQLFSKVLIKSDSDEMSIFQYIEGSWQSLEELEDRAFFEERVFLIPDEKTLFCRRTFPMREVSESVLTEAVKLDVESWNPWPEEAEYYYWPVKSGDQWQVAVWIWPSSYSRQIQSEIVGASATHVLPEIAWKVAAISKGKCPALLFSTNSSDRLFCVVLSEIGLPEALVYLDDKPRATTFWRLLSKEQRSFSVIMDSEGYQLPEWVQSSEVVNMTLPVKKALSQGRVPGVQDWTDAFSWFKPITTFLLAYSDWLLGTSLATWNQGDQVREQLAEARAEAMEVIDKRKNVEEIHSVLSDIYTLRREQPRFEEMLATLSKKIPKHTWLDSVRYDYSEGGWLDLSGKTPQSAELLAILDALPDIERVAFLSDIRKDAKTGLEAFRIRIKLSSIEQQEVIQNVE